MKTPSPLLLFHTLKYLLSYFQALSKRLLPCKCTSRLLPCLRRTTSTYYQPPSSPFQRILTCTSYLISLIPGGNTVYPETVVIKSTPVHKPRKVYVLRIFRMKTFSQSLISVWRMLNLKGQTENSLEVEELWKEEKEPVGVDEGRHLTEFPPRSTSFIYSCVLKGFTW